MNVNNSTGKILVAIAQSINELIVNQNFSLALDNTVRILGNAFDTDCLLTRFHVEGDSVINTVEHYSLKVFDEKRVNRKINVLLKPFFDIYTQLDQGNVYAFNTSEIPKPINRIIKNSGGDFGVLIPIHLDGSLWGVVSLIGMSSEKNWTESVASLMVSLSSAISATLSKIAHRLGLEQQLEERSLEIIEQNHRYASLIDNVPGIIFRCKNDEYWTMEFISNYVFDLTGYHSNEFIGQPHDFHFGQIIHPSDQEFVQEDIHHQLKLGDSYKISYRIVCKDKSVKWVWEQGVSHSNDHEMLEGCIIDITDRVDAHEKVLAATLETEERERSRISRSIHDNLQQLLTTAHLNLALVVSKNDLPKEGYKRLEIANEYLQRAITESRSLSHKLMPKAIEDFGFQRAVEDLINNLNGTIETSFEFFDNLAGQRLPETIELCLFRITQEAVTNIIKFAHAKKVTIQLLQHVDSIILTIEDDGVGFDQKIDNNVSGAFGVNSMKNRSTSVGGQFYLDSQVGKGTQLMVEIPNEKPM